MDHFGIGNALKGAARVIFQSARRTGRTTSLLHSLKDGDRIIVANSNQQRHLTQLLKERNLNVEVKLLPVERADELFSMGTAQGRTIFDHPWVEQFYEKQIEWAETYIDQAQDRLTGWGEAHEQTKRAAIEQARWKL